MFTWTTVENRPKILECHKGPYRLIVEEATAPGAVFYVWQVTKDAEIVAGGLVESGLRARTMAAIETTKRLPVRMTQMA